ncbi:MAG: hypothetical protein Athens071425_329 [Parcubacteria group bacterium Athens0714_25]|nr:MAG: hypothetical protein Athens071425_329 [Parcubacteria group bacterium Athens0714_25]
MKLLIATTNKNKLDQFREIFKIHGADFELVSLSDVGIFDDVEEDAGVFWKKVRSGFFV